MQCREDFISCSQYQTSLLIIERMLFVNKLRVLSAGFEILSLLFTLLNQCFKDAHLLSQTFSTISFLFVVFSTIIYNCFCEPDILDYERAIDKQRDQDVIMTRLLTNLLAPTYALLFLSVLTNICLVCINQAIFIMREEDGQYSSAFMEQEVIEDETTQS